MMDWISVSDRLPDKEDLVLIWPCDSEHATGNLRDSDPVSFRIACCGQTARDVTHWMPLPEGPEDIKP